MEASNVCVIAIRRVITTPPTNRRIAMYIYTTNRACGCHTTRKVNFYFEGPLNSEGTKNKWRVELKIVSTNLHSKVWWKSTKSFVYIPQRGIYRDSRICQLGKGSEGDCDVVRIIETIYNGEVDRVPIVHVR